jgi:hypothetical protein
VRILSGEDMAASSSPKSETKPSPGIERRESAGLKFMTFAVQSDD